MLVIGLVLTLLPSIFVYLYSRNIKILIAHAMLLIITPWVLNIFLSKPTIIEYILAKPKDLSFLANLGQITSTDYIFFKTVPKVKYAVGDYGYFLPGFLPLVISGFWKFLTDKKIRGLIYVFILSIFVCSFLMYYVGYFSTNFLLPFLSIFATFGFFKFVRLLKTKKMSIYIKLLISANFLLIFYEVLRLIHSLNVQMEL